MNATKTVLFQFHRATCRICQQQKKLCQERVKDLGVFIDEKLKSTAYVLIKTVTSFFEVEKHHSMEYYILYQVETLTAIVHFFSRPIGAEKIRFKETKHRRMSRKG